MLTHPESTLSGALSDAWTIDPAITYLNHGAFGAAPGPVLERQADLRRELEREPMLFLDRLLEPRLDAARAALAEVVGSAPQDLVFVPNATAGVNTALRAVTLRAGDEILATNHGYNACLNAARDRAEELGAKLVVAEVPFPLTAAAQVTDAVLARLTSRTRLLMIDHVTSQTGLVFPLERLLAECRARGIVTVVDGAHAPGMVPLTLRTLGADYYTGNCHKWLCAPKAVAFLWVRRELQAALRPLVISHGANSPRTDRSRFLIEFDWTGTHDPTPALCIPTAIAFLSSLLPGGLAALQARNRALALAARERLCQELGAAPPSPPEMIGSLASVPLPPSDQPALALEAALFEGHRIEVPIFPWPSAPARVVRISAQGYNRLADYERLAAALATELAEGGRSAARRN